MQRGFGVLLSFLCAAAESYRYRGLDWEKIGPDDNASLFPRPVVQWAYQFSNELEMLKIELNETEGLIES